MGFMGFWQCLAKPKFRFGKVAVQSDIISTLHHFTWSRYIHRGSVVNHDSVISINCHSFRVSYRDAMINRRSFGTGNKGCGDFLYNSIAFRCITHYITHLHPYTSWFYPHRRWSLGLTRDLPVFSGMAGNNDACTWQEILYTALMDDVQSFLLGIIASTLAYSINICLATICLRVLLRERTEDASKKRRFTLCVYIVGMLGLATASFVRSNLAFMEAYRIVLISAPYTFRGDGYGRVSYIVYEKDGIQLYDSVVSPAMPITIWCSDGILVRMFLW